MGGKKYMEIHSHKLFIPISHADSNPNHSTTPRTTRNKLYAASFYLQSRREFHKKFARWTWPIWIYVSITGVVIYFLLYQIFPSPR